MITLTFGQTRQTLPVEAAMALHTAMLNDAPHSSPVAQAVGADPTDALLAAGLELRALLFPQWHAAHTARMEAYPQHAACFSTPSALQCTATVLAMGGTSRDRDPHAAPGETGFLAIGEGHFADRRQGPAIWAPHSWIAMDNGWSFDITADQFGHDPVALTPPTGLRIAHPDAPTAALVYKPPAHLHYLRAPRPRAAGLDRRNTARAWVRRIGQDSALFARWSRALTTIQALGRLDTPALSPAHHAA